MTKAKKFKKRVRELAARLGVPHQTALQRIPRKYYRLRLILTALDGRVTGERVVNLSSFAKTGAFVRLTDGSRFQVWHPILKAHIKPEPRESDLPALCVYPAPDDGPVSVVEVTDGVRVMPVLMDLRGGGVPRGVQRYVTRPYAKDDGIDIEIQEQWGATRLHGHHVYEGPNGLYLKQETLDVEYVPFYRIRLPQRPSGLAA